MTLQRDTSLWGRTRDKIAYGIANFALRRIATPWYRGMIEGSIQYGLRAAVRDEYEEQVD